MIRKGARTLGVAVVATLALGMAGAAVAQSPGGDGAGEGRGGFGGERFERPDPPRRLEAIDALGRDLHLNAEQARLYAGVRGDAARILRDRHPARPEDPFAAAAARVEPDQATLETDRRGLLADGTTLHSSLDASQRAMLTARWRETFGPLAGLGGGRRERGEGEGGPRFRRGPGGRPPADADGGGERP